MFSLFLIAIALAMDAFAVSVINGSQYKEMSLGVALKIALFFGLFQAFMPLIGYFVGGYVSQYIQTYAPYITFAILVYLGIDMIRDAENEDGNGLDTKTLLLLAVATSIDALAVGFAFSLQKGVDIWFSVLVIGVVTFVLSFLGIYLGRKLGSYLQRHAEYLGGGILILLGIDALFS